MQKPPFNNPVAAPPAGTLADKVAQTGVWVLQRALEIGADLLGHTVATGLVAFLDTIEPNLRARGKGLVNEAIAAPGMPSNLKAYLQEVEAGGHETDGVAGFINRVILSVLGFTGYFSAYNRLTEYQTERHIHTARLGPGDLILGIRCGVISDQEATSQLLDQGYTADYLGRFKAIAARLPQVSEIATAMFRGVISEQDALKRLRDLGYTDDDAALIRNIFPVLPGVTELISMAVKEVFTPEIAERFGQYEDFPPRFAQEAAKQGLSAEWARAYWAAHWDLPSATQGFEMLHRGIISYDDLKLLLRALDVMPFWRDRLIGISYNPYTRVDTRRMYDAGILDRDGVKRAYLDQGYDEEHATNLTNWTIRERKDEERDLTKAEVLSAYSYDLLTEDEARARLKALRYDDGEVSLFIALQNAKDKGKAKTPDKALQKADLVASYVQDLITQADMEAAFRNMGYDTSEVKILVQLADIQKRKPKREANKDLAKSEILTAYRDSLIDKGKTATMLLALGYEQDEVDFLVSLADYQLNRDRTADKINTAHILYVNGVKSEQDTLATLNALNLPDTTLQYYLYKWGFELENKIATPTLSQLMQFRKAKIIDDPTLREELTLMGYPEKYIEWYMKLLAKQIPPA